MDMLGRALWTLVTCSLLLALPFLAMTVTNLAHGPSHHADASTCTRGCHDHGCAHTAAIVDLRSAPARAARAVYLENIRLLHASPLGYQPTNLLVYVLLAPTVAGLSLAAVLWPGVPVGRPRVGATATLALGVAGLGAIVAQQAEGLNRWSSLYWFCTDFCIHAANDLGITYEIFNFGLFVVGFPVVVIGLAAVALLRVARWLVASAEYLHPGDVHARRAVTGGWRTRQGSRDESMDVGPGGADVDGLRERQGRR